MRRDDEDLFSRFVYNLYKICYFSKFFIILFTNALACGIIQVWDGNRPAIAPRKEGHTMKITVNARQMTVRESLKEMVIKKLEKLDKYFPAEGEATVTFSRKHDKENLEITIFAANTLFRSEIEDETFQNALDRSVDTIERQIRKNKTRLEKRLRDGAFADEYFEEDGDEETEFKIRTKTFSYKPMSVEEAILQMNLLDHEFFVFEEDESGDVCVVYKRKDGDYGLIAPSK